MSETKTSPPSPPSAALFAATVFVGAFLLFLVQPLIAKYILPWFGGSPGVWTTCMVFFQVVLLAGYAYAHALLTWVPARGQVAVHLLLLATAVAVLPIVPGEGWKPQTEADPTWRILGLLGVSVGLPYLLVASTGPLVQGWAARRAGGGAAASPYRLYALSNLASLAALLGYPFAIEPAVTRRAQAVGWSVAFAGFAILSAACALVARRAAAAAVGRAQDVARSAPPAVAWVTMWLLLPACGTMVLLATTNKVSQEVAVIPFLWVLPLALYLLTFVVAFDGPRWYVRGLFLGLLPVAVAGVTVVLFLGGGMPIAVQLGAFLAALFVACMVCHGELARLKPPADRLTGYYLALSAGGALGGVFVAVAAPLLFVTYFEFPLALILTGVLAGVVLFTDPASRLHAGRPNWAWLTMITLFMLLGYGLVAGHGGAPGRVVAATRSFYGAVSVVARDEDKPPIAARMLRHGAITHGLQFTAAARRAETTAYYGPTSGVGLALQHLMPGSARDGGRRIGAVGLGAGTLAAYGRPGDTFRFYEINPDVLAYAKEHFTFLKDSVAAVEHVVGDARLSLEREPDQRFDLLVLDAFNGDAIPVHLLTREAFDLYRRHVKPDGVIAVHITNQHLDLRPVVRAGAEHLGLKTRFVLDDQSHENFARHTSEWTLIGPDEAWLAGLPVRPFTVTLPRVETRLWTDDAASLFSVLR
jgi:hypothetical protein